MKRVYFRSLSVVIFAGYCTFIVILNLLPERIALPQDLGVFSSPWSGDPHTAYGWPFLMIRFFDKVSVINSSGAYDYIAMALNFITWITGFALLAVSLIGFSRLCANKQDNKITDSADVCTSTES